MSIQELLADPSIICNEEGNILCIKIKNQREHHLNPQMVMNEARMTNEGWMIKRKPVANGNHNMELKFAVPLPEDFNILGETKTKELNNIVVSSEIIEDKIIKRKGGRPVGSKNKKAKTIKQKK